jgi:hypothetical protein
VPAGFPPTGGRPPGREWELDVECIMMWFLVWNGQPSTGDTGNAVRLVTE